MSCQNSYQTGIRTNTFTHPLAIGLSGERTISVP
jgi:hypothetical protein